MKQVRTASVGLGWVTTNRHLPTMMADPRYQVVGVIDRRAERVDETVRRHPRLKGAVSPGLGNVPWIDEVDAIVIGTNPFTHFALVKEALALGKHVITEKPFAMNVAEGEEMVTLARAQGLILGVVHNFQFASSSLRLLADLEAGRLGTLHSVVATQLSNPRRRLPTWCEDLPLGLFYDESPHLLYLLSRFSPSEPRMLRCDVFPSTMGKETPASVIAQYVAKRPDGVEIPVTMHLQFETPVSEWHLTLNGEEMLGDIDVFRDIYIRLPNDGLHTTRTVFRTTTAATFQHWGQHFTSGVKHLRGNLRYGNDEVFGRFADAVITGKPPLGISGEDALRVLKMQHQIVAAAAPESVIR